MKSPPGPEIRVSGFATASLALSVLALGLLGVAWRVTLTGSRDAGALMSAVLVTAGGLCGIVAPLLLLVTPVHVLCAKGKRSASPRAWFSLVLVLLDLAALRMLGSEWAERFFKW